MAQNGGILKIYTASDTPHKEPTKKEDFILVNKERERLQCSVPPEKKYWQFHDRRFAEESSSRHKCQSVRNVAFIIQFDPSLDFAETSFHEKFILNFILINPYLS